MLCGTSVTVKVSLNILKKYYFMQFKIINQYGKLRKKHFKTANFTGIEDSDRPRLKPILKVHLLTSEKGKLARYLRILTSEMAQ